MVRSSRGKLTTGGWEEVGDKMEDDMEVDDEDENMDSEHKQNSGRKSRYKLEWRFISNILKLGFLLEGGSAPIGTQKSPENHEARGREAVPLKVLISLGLVSTFNEILIEFYWTW